MQFLIMAQSAAIALQLGGDGINCWFINAQLHQMY